MAMTTTLPGGHRARKPRLASNLGIPVTSLPVMSQPLAQLPGGRVVREGAMRERIGRFVISGLEFREEWKFVFYLSGLGYSCEFWEEGQGSLGIEWFKKIRSNCFLLEMMYMYHGNIFRIFVSEFLFCRSIQTETGNCELI